MKGIAIPFRIRNGKILCSLDEARVKEKLKALFNIVEGEYFLEPKLGVANWVFSNMNPFILKSIREQLETYIPEIEILELSYSYEEPGTVVISLKYRFEAKEDTMYVYKTI